MSDRFALLEEIGIGGMGSVWRARDVATGEIVALKLLHRQFVADSDYVARFEREVEIATRIESPHVVKTRGYGTREGIPYAAMEYVAGQSLREMLKTEGPVGWDGAKRIAIQLTTALAAAHGAGIIHRDIKPSNVLLDEHGDVKLADFGIARAHDLTRMTGSVTTLGTPAYMSPDGEASEQSDLYALGCVLYELMAGAPPFEGESQQQVLLKHIRQAPNLERVPASAKKIVAWLLEKDPKRRPASAEVLLAVLQGSSPTPAVDVSQQVQDEPRGGGRRYRSAGRSAGLIVVVVGITYGVMLFKGLGGYFSGDDTETNPAGDELGLAVSPAPEDGAALFVRTAKTLAVEAANERGTPTGIIVEPGEKLEVRGVGTWCVALDWCGGADGARDPQRPDPDARVPQSPIGSLMARVGGQDWFSTAESDLSSTRTRGELILAMNDVPGGYSDNSGRLWVTLRVLTR